MTSAIGPVRAHCQICHSNKEGSQIAQGSEANLTVVHRMLEVIVHQADVGSNKEMEKYVTLVIGREKDHYRQPHQQWAVYGKVAARRVGIIEKEHNSGTVLPRGVRDSRKMGLGHPDESSRTDHMLNVHQQLPRRTTSGVQT